MWRRLANFLMLVVRFWNEATVPTVALRCKGCRRWKNDTLGESEKYLVFHDAILLTWHVLDLDLINARWQGWWLWELHLRGQQMCKQCPTMRNTSRKVLNCLKTNVVTPTGCGKFSFLGDSQLTVLVIQKTPVLRSKSLYTMF